MKPIAGLSLLKSYASDFTNNVFEKLIEKEMLKLKNAKRKRMEQEKNVSLEIAKIVTGITFVKHAKLSIGIINVFLKA